MAVRAQGPATLRVSQALDAALTDADARLVVGCSGGPDSLALAAAVARLAPRTGRRVAARVVDHGLQAGSDRVATEVVDRLRALGLADCRVLPVQVRDGGQGPEAAARDARYAVLLAAAEETDATVLLGHTRNDQAESVLLGLARGSGTRSLAGMAPRSGRLLRPLLDLERSVTVTACAEQGLTWWDDPHNADAAYTRARVRHVVLPVLEDQLGRGVVAALARTATLARADADLLDQLAAQADPGDADPDCATLAALPDALRSRVLLRWLRRCGCDQPTHTHVAAVDALLTRWRGQVGVDLPGGTVARRSGRLLWQAVARG